MWIGRFPQKLDSSAISRIDGAYRYSIDHFEEDFIISVLEVSNFLDIPDGKDWAIKELPRIATFNPILQLKLAHRYWIDHWIEPAFKALMATPLQNITINEAAGISLPFYTILVKTKLKIEDHHRGIAFVAPLAQNDLLCNTPLKCCHSWGVEWLNRLAKQLFHPNASMTGHQVLQGLDTIWILGMCSLCEGRTIDWVKLTGVFVKEEFVKEAVQDLMAWQTNEPIRANM